MHLPMDIKVLYKLSTTVIGGQEFNVVLRSEDSPSYFAEKKWSGSVFGDLTAYTPFASVANFDHSIERALQIVFTRFALGEFSHGMFVVKAQMGQDWFTPILQQPHCVLRQMSKLSFSKNDLDSTLSTRKRSATIGTSNPSGFETCIVFYLGHNVKEFCSAFYSLGLIPGINSWSAVMTTDPILDSEESSFEVDNQSFSLPMGKQFCIDELKHENPMLGMHDPLDTFVDTDNLLDLNDLGSLSARYF